MAQEVKTFILSTTPGYEKRVASDVIRRRDALHNEYIVEASAPTMIEEYVDKKTTTKKTKTVLIMKGYCLVDVLIDGEMDPDTQSLLTMTPNVIGFVSMDRKKPLPISNKEKRRLAELSAAALVAKKEVFNVGDVLEIFSGAFTGFFGIVISDDGNKLRAEVNIFERKTVVEIERTNARRKK